jgi:hypothetical protein
MSSERASKVRMRQSGQICAICDSRLPPPHSPGEKRCAQCGGKRRIYMYFFHRRGWSLQFLEADLKTSLPRKLTFLEAGKILKLAQRGGAVLDLEARHAFDHAITTGRGGIWLELTDAQYQKLKSAR